MTIQTIGNAILILLLIGWVGYRQLTWRPVSIPKMWRAPAILAVVGAVLLAQQVDPRALVPLDFAVLAGELVLSFAIGAWMGKLAHVRPLVQPVVVGKDGAVATYESRTGWWGLALWAAVIVVRIGVDVLATHAGSHLATATGVILLVFAANRAARTAVFAARLERHAALAA